MESVIAPIAVFFLFGGGVIVVAIIIVRGFLKRKSTARPFAQWAAVALLSLGQIGCWRMLAGFDSAFGVHGSYDVVHWAFGSLVAAWLCYQVVAYLLGRRRFNN